MQKVITPEVGMGASIGYGCDSYPYTVHQVQKNRMWISRDNHAFVNGDIEYSNDDALSPDKWTLCTLRNDDEWHVGTTLKGAVVYLGVRLYVQDPSF